MITEKFQVPVGSRTECVTLERLTEGTRGLRGSHRKPSAQWKLPGGLWQLTHPAVQAVHKEQHFALV